LNGIVSKYIFLCVIYNKKYDESETVITFFNSINNACNNELNFQSELHVWDNSTDDEVSTYNARSGSSDCITYHSSGKNEKLSVIYNKFINDYPDSVLIIFDDDSNISSSYMRAVLNLDQKHEFSIAVPRVISQTGNMYSPAKFGLVKGKHLENISSGFHSGLVAITSGVAINCNRVIQEGLFFDKRLNLYGVDTDFFLSASYKKIDIYVLDVYIDHDLSYFNEEKVKIKRARFLNLMKSNFHISRKRSLAHVLLYVIYALLVFMKNIKLFLFK